jgi:hypothetical protein
MTLGRSTLIAFFVLILVGCGAARADSAAATPGAPQGGPNRAYGRRATLAGEAAPDVDRDGVMMEKTADEAPPAEPASDMGAKAPPPVAPQPPGEKKPEPAKQGPRAEGTEAPHDTSMLIYTARITMAVYQVDQGLAAVEKIAKDMGGYLSLKRDREITVRVPRSRFEPMLAAVDKIGDVLHRDIQAQDVTDEFVDTEIRIKNARAMQVRLKVLLEKAMVKEALEIEKEMRRVTEEIELLEGKLKLLKDKIAYSTITVAFEARGSTIQSTRIRLPFPWLTSLGLPTLLRLSEER